MQLHDLENQRSKSDNNLISSEKDLKEHIFKLN